jgi:hypothetical protein
LAMHLFCQNVLQISSSLTFLAGVLPLIWKSMLYRGYMIFSANPIHNFQILQSIVWILKKEFGFFFPILYKIMLLNLVWRK